MRCQGFVSPGTRRRPDSVGRYQRAQDAPFIRVRACAIVRSFHIRVKALPGARPAALRDGGVD